MTTKNTQYLKRAYKWEIEVGVKAKVTEIDFNVSVTILITSGTFSATENSTYVLPKPFFHHGTIRAFNEDRQEIPSNRGKYPFVFMLERMSEDFDFDKVSSIDRTSPLRLYFLTNYDKGKAKTDEQYEEIIKPMGNVLENFITLLRKSNIVSEDTFENTASITNFVRFGTYTDNTGNENALTDEIVSGKGLDINVIFLKNFKCN